MSDPMVWVYIAGVLLTIQVVLPLWRQRKCLRAGHRWKSDPEHEWVCGRCGSHFRIW